MDHIRQIMELEESLQRNIMQAIQELESSYQGSMASKASSISNFDTKSIQEDRDRLAQKCHEAERQIALLLEEKSQMAQELNKLQREVEVYENPKGAIIGDDGTSLGPIGMWFFLRHFFVKLYKNVVCGHLLGTVMFSSIV